MLGIPRLPKDVIYEAPWLVNKEVYRGGLIKPPMNEGAPATVHNQVEVNFRIL